MPPRCSLIALALAWVLAGCIAREPNAPNAPNAPAPPPGVAPPLSAHAFVWPHGTRAAVSLTYDDALQSQIDHAVPALARYALPATFFLTGSSSYLQANPQLFRALVTAGHELGSHTLYHPCDRAQSWVKPGFALQDYDLERMQKELADSIQQLQELGQKAPFSFAYPCGSSWVGEAHTSYVSLVEQSFVAARGVGSAIANPSGVDLFNVPSPAGNDSGAALTAWVDRALESGGWVVFLFHGVAGDYLDVKADAHEALLAYLNQHKSSVWTERFGTVASYVKARTPAPLP